jgi:hypothetical protein
MPDQTNTPPSDPNPTPNSPRTRSEQDVQIANDISGSKQVIELLQNDATVRAPLVARGFDTQQIEAGDALQAAAQDRFKERQNAMGEQEDCTQKLSDATTSARETYADFRKTVTSVYTSKGQRTALGCTGKVPADLQQFVTVATASYTTAKAQTYQADLARFGYPTATLDANLEALKQLNALRKKQATAIGDAVSATSRRNDAHNSLMDWVRQLRGIASVAFRNQPEQAQKLDF